MSTIKEAREKIIDILNHHELNDSEGVFDYSERDAKIDQIIASVALDANDWRSVELKSIKCIPPVEAADICPACSGTKYITRVSGAETCGQCNGTGFINPRAVFNCIKSADIKAAPVAYISRTSLDHFAEELAQGKGYRQFAIANASNMPNGDKTVPLFTHTNTNATEDTIDAWVNAVQDMLNKTLPAEHKLIYGEVRYALKIAGLIP